MNFICKENTMNKKKWFIVGYLPTGETVHCNETGDFAKYMDFQYLVGMRRDELKSVLPERRDYERK